jgi:hypothetical protein
MARPRKDDADAKRATIATRVTQDLRSKLEEASAQSGRSLAQEIEIRLERSLEFASIVDAAMSAAQSAIDQSYAMLVGLAGGEDNFSVAVYLGYSASLIERQTGKSWKDDEATRHKVEAHLLSIIPGALRDPPPALALGRKAQPLPPSPAGSLGALGALYESAKQLAAERGEAFPAVAPAAAPRKRKAD